MADWVVSDAGDDTYNGDYDEAGEHEGKPYYTYGDPVRYLAWNGSASIWVLWDQLPVFIQRGDYSGTEADLPANPWEVEGGAGPAPTVAAAGGDIYEHDLSGEILLAGGWLHIVEVIHEIRGELAVAGSLASGGPTTYLAGVIDEVFIEADARVVEDVRQRLAFPAMGEIGQWRFNEGYGLKAQPVGMAGGATITLVDTSWTTGYIGKAIVLDGTAYGTFPSTAGTAANVGIELMMQFAAGDACTLIDQDGGLNFAYTGTHFRAALTGVTNAAADIAPFTPDLDVWYSVALVYDGAQKSVWLNGQKIGETAATGTATISANAVHIGETHAGAARLNGKLDSLLIAKHVVRPYYRPVRRWLLMRGGFEAKEDWVLM